MKATELRIGNWVDALCGNGTYVEDQVDSGVYIDLFKDIGKAKPIPLTKDWLLRFGFELDADAPEFDNEYFKGPLSINIPSVVFMGGGDNFNLNIKMEYVHQIQNLYFALTGEELTIKQ